MKRWPWACDLGHRLFQGRVGQARFERRPTIGNRREIMVGRRGEAPLVPPYSFRRPNKAMAVASDLAELTSPKVVAIISPLSFREFCVNYRRTFRVRSG